MIRYCTELQSVQYLNPHAVSVQEEDMLDIKFVRENPEIVKQNIRNKFQDSKLENCKTREGAIWHSCNKKGQHIKSASDVPGSMAHVLLVRE